MCEWSLRRAYITALISINCFVSVRNSGLWYKSCNKMARRCNKYNGQFEMHIQNGLKWILTWSQISSHFFSLSYCLRSLTLSGGRFIEFWGRQRELTFFSKCIYFMHMMSFCNVHTHQNKHWDHYSGQLAKKPYLHSNKKMLGRF